MQFEMSPNVAYISRGDVYPASGGATAGERIGAMYGGFQRHEGYEQTPEAAPADSTPATMPGGGSLVITAVTLVALWVLLTWVARRSSEAEDYRNIKGSAYNVVVIGLAAIIFVPILKWLTAKFPIPGVTAWVHAA